MNYSFTFEYGKILGGQIFGQQKIPPEDNWWETHKERENTKRALNDYKLWERRGMAPKWGK